MGNKYFVYILESETDGSLYIGQTEDLIQRLKRHNKGYCKSTKSKIPYRLCYFEEHYTRRDSMHREWEIKKKYNTERRRRLISSFDKLKLLDFQGL